MLCGSKPYVNPAQTATADEFHTRRLMYTTSTDAAIASNTWKAMTPKRPQVA
jgi:hypothetical protein